MKIVTGVIFFQIKKNNRISVFLLVDSQRKTMVADSAIADCLEF